jgi:hypothetical protein
MEGGMSFGTMLCRVVFVIFLAFMSVTARAFEAPAGQTVIDADKVLRGHFVEIHQTNGTQPPLQTSGHFVVAPAQGLLWYVEKPFPTLTIITPRGMAQDIGGLALKLPAKNLRHLYDMVGGALAGDWSGLESDFTITSSGTAGHWEMLLMPRQDSQNKLPYAAITISGGNFVENIAITKTDGQQDAFSFTGAALSPAPLTDKESAAFHKIQP